MNNYSSTKYNLTANAERNLAIKNKLCAAVVASLGLAASLAIQINTEVIMRTSIAMTAHTSITVLCLVAGAGLLGSQASIPKRGETDCRTNLFRPKRTPTGGSIPPLPTSLIRREIQK